jgi:hypothetical protein
MGVAERIITRINTHSRNGTVDRATLTFIMSILYPLCGSKCRKHSYYRAGERTDRVITMFDFLSTAAWVTDQCIFEHEIEHGRNVICGDPAISVILKNWDGEFTAYQSLVIISHPPDFITLM